MATINNPVIKILIVDDEPDLLFISKRVLNLENYHVTTASNEKECMEAIQRDKPDLLLLDVMLGDSNGVDICKTLKNDPANSSIYIILLSGSKIESENISEGLETGADGYLIKPLKNRELLARVEAAYRIIVAEKALRKSEEKYYYMFAHNPQPMWIYDVDTLEFMEVNEAAVKHHGYSREEFLSMKLQDIYPKEDLPVLQEEIAKAKSGENITGEWRQVKKNGEIIYVEITAHKLIYNDRIAFHVLINDVTERKYIETELKNSQDLLRKFAIHLQNNQEDEKILLATQLDNELSQILVALKMDIGILKKKVLKENVSSDSEDLFLKLDHVYNVIGKSIDTSMKFMNEQRNEVLYLVGFIEAVRLYLSDFQEKFNIVSEFVSNTSTLNLNRQKSTSLFRIFQSATSNVVQHSKASKMRVNLSLCENKLTLEIWDNGIGFDPEKLSNSDSTGLIFMKERALLLNGELQIESLENQGTNIRVEIPYTNK
jgi:PAS domain S-box-containing protein